MEYILTVDDEDMDLRLVRQRFTKIPHAYTQHTDGSLTQIHHYSDQVCTTLFNLFLKL